MRYFPAGAFSILKLPSSSVTAKYGLLKTRTQALIQPWMLQLICHGGDVTAVQPATSTEPSTGISGFRLGLLSGESILVLCGTLPEFLTTSVCPSRRQMTW